MTVFLKPSQVASRLNVSRRAAYYLISSGELPSITVGEKSLRVDENDLNAYIDSRRSDKGKRDESNAGR